MILNESKFNFDRSINKIIQDLESDKRTKSEVLRELMIIRLAIYLSKSDEIDKILFSLNKMLYRKSDFELVLWNMNDAQKVMKKMMRLIVNPRKIPR